MIGELITAAESLHSALRRRRAVNVNDQNTKSQVIELASRYFKEVRPNLTYAVGENDLLGHDKQWQQLLRLAHGNNSRRTYLKMLVHIRKELLEFSVFALTVPQPEDVRSASAPSPEELAILKTLDAL